MNVRFYAKLMARVAFVLGILAVASCFSVAYLFYGMMCSILGTLLGISVVFVRTRYGMPTRWNHLSILSIILCSVPVIYIMIILFIIK